MGRVAHFFGEVLNVASHVVFEPLSLCTRWTKKQLGLLRPIRAVPFLGYGDRRRWHVFGRVQEVRPVREPQPIDPAWRNLVAIWGRFRTSHVPATPVVIRLGNREIRKCTDEDGYFDFEVAAPEEFDRGITWQRVSIELPAEGGRTAQPAKTEAKVLVASERARFGVVSDVDDTIMYSHATDMLRLIRLTITNNSRTRVPLPGASTFYRLLQRGADGDADNPFFYVSSAAWNLFDLVEDFLEVNGFPRGPLLMREFGILSGRVLRSNHDHKIEKLERILGTTEDLPFLLIGDAGQHDPQLYHRVACAHPDRVAAIYIRNVHWLDRRDEIERLAADLAQRGVRMELFDDTLEMARRAVADGFLAEEALEAVEAGRTEDERLVESARPRPARRAPDDASPPTA